MCSVAEGKGKKLCGSGSLMGALMSLIIATVAICATDIFVVQRNLSQTGMFVPQRPRMFELRGTSNPAGVMWNFSVDLGLRSGRKRRNLSQTGMFVPQRPFLLV